MKLLTSRKGHFRSGKFFGGADSLVNVDNAIAAYQANPTGPNRHALRTAFDAWAEENKKEVRERDVAVNGETEGCITKLRNWLHADRGAAMGGVRMI